MLSFVVIGMMLFFYELGRIAELESSTMQQNATIKDLTEQRDDFKQRIAVLESLRQNLEKNSLSQVEEQEIRLRTLQKVRIFKGSD